MPPKSQSGSSTLTLQSIAVFPRTPQSPNTRFTPATPSYTPATANARVTALYAPGTPRTANARLFPRTPRTARPPVEYLSEEDEDEEGVEEHDALLDDDDSVSLAESVSSDEKVQDEGSGLSGRDKRGMVLLTLLCESISRHLEPTWGN
jgi:hypothetical protein